MIATDKNIKHHSITITLVTIVLFFAFSFHAKGNTITGSGNWDNTGIWSGANIADNVNENVNINNSLGTITVRNTFNYTVGNVVMGKENTLTIANGGTLNIGSSGNTRNFSADKTTRVNVFGTLIIWGDFTVNKDLVLVVTGTLIIKGDLIMDKDADLDISGSVTIDGDFKADKDAVVNVDGDVTVGGDLEVGKDSTLSGTGTMTVAGNCSDNNSTFCGTGPLPVSLLFFGASNVEGRMELKWATASELNFDYFSIERSVDAKIFNEIGQVTGHGTTVIRHDYTFEDVFPLGQKLYYRLKAVDFDGYEEYFNIASVDFGGTKQVSVYPNPVVGGFLNIQFNFSPESATLIQITDMVGVEKMRQMRNGNENQFSIPIALDPGAYIIRIQSDEFKSIDRILVK